MKLVATAYLFLAAPAAFAQTWQCKNNETGHSYIANQSVPLDACRVVSENNPYSYDTDRPVPRRLANSGSCDKMVALDVQSGIREFAKWRIEGDHLAVHWVYKIEKLPEAERLRMVRTYADMDACLSGGAREIMFYRKEKLMGIASPASGVRLIK